jgi:hypothetical protein
MLFALFASAALAQHGFVIVVNKDNPNTKLTKALLRRMLMGETATWPSGEKVTIFLGPAGNAARTAALKEFCGMSESDFSKHALQASFDAESPFPKASPRTPPFASWFRVLRTVWASWRPVVRKVR